jgi:hypothetical protein
MPDMTYTVPPPPLRPKARYVRVTDDAEVAAIMRACLRDPIGEFRNGEYWAEAKSLAQFRGQRVEFDI